MSKNFSAKIFKQIFKRLAYQKTPGGETKIKPKFAFIGFGIFWFWLGYWFAQNYKDLILIGYGIGLTYIGYVFHKVRNNGDTKLAK